MSTRLVAKSATAGARRNFGGLSPDERQERRRQQLISAGIELFGTRGYHESGVRELCGAAKLTERYFYESFQNREALFLAVYHHAVEKVRTAITAALGSVPTEPMLMARAGSRAFLETLQAEPHLSRVLMIEVLAIGPRAGESLLATQSFAELINTITSTFFPKLARRNLDSRLIADGLIGATVYIAMQWAAGGFREPLEQILNHCLLFYEPLLQPAKATRSPPRPKRRVPLRR